MTMAFHELRASYAFVERNINLVKRYWGWELVCCWKGKQSQSEPGCFRKS